MKKICVVGGGTIGWMSALYIKKKYPSYQVTLIESSSVGIIGVGESTTTAFPHFLQYIGVDIFDLMKATGATFKTGTKFTNWNKDGGHYFSIMTPWHPMLLPSSYSPIHNVDDLLFANLVANDIPITTTGAPKLISNSKSPFFVKDGQLQQYGYFSIHIDGIKTTAYLREFSKDKGITVVDNLVSHFENDANNNINNIVFKDGTEIDTDFVFDCSGFAKLGIGKHYSGEWEDYKQYLPVDSTITTMLPTTEKLPTYTECIAMKHGWMFKVPMKDRFGSGYNFDSRYTTWEEAQAEIEEYWGHTITPVKKLTFNAGHFKKIWIGNCVALGLSSGFIEPMAGSNIAIANDIVQLVDLEKFFTNDTSVADYANSEFARYNELFLSNIYFRYQTNRTDTQFWKNFHEKEMPARLKRITNEFKTDKDIFKFSSELAQSPIIWLSAIQGLNVPEYIDIVKDIKLDKDAIQLVADQINSITSELMDTSIEHREFLDTRL